MALSQNATALKLALNRANPTDLADQLRSIGFGDILRAYPTMLRRKFPAANLYNIATANCITLPDDAKAAVIFRAYAHATSAAGTLGSLVVDADASAPLDGHVSIQPNGDICLGTVAGAYTDCDVFYLPQKQDIVEIVLPVVAATGVCALPISLTGIAPTATVPSAAGTGVTNLLEAEALVGTVPGKKIVLVAAAGAPATLNARLDVAMKNVQFAVADGVTSARVKVGVTSKLDVDALLEAISNFL